jgi:hypothetical protein
MPPSKVLDREKDRQLGPIPWVQVLGYMDAQLAIRLSWSLGVKVISTSRLRFLRDELEIEVRDDPSTYVL